MSTVIKAGHKGSVVKRLAAVDLSDHLAEAKGVIEAACRQAEQVTARAREEARIAVESARAEGHEAGYREGRSAGEAAGQREAFERAMAEFRERHEGAARAMAAAAATIESMKDDLRIAAERDVLDLALLIARKLTFEFGRVHREAATANLQRALALVDRRTDLSVRINPADRETLETFAASLGRTVKDGGHVRLVDDPAVAPGGCVVESGPTEVDATLETQLEQVVAVLAGDRGHSFTERESSDG